MGSRAGTVAGSIAGSMVAGAAAGLAGTTSLNAATYLDMVMRARPASSTPQESVEKLSDVSGIEIPGDKEERENRVQGLGPMLGIATGIGAGVAVGAATALAVRAGLRPGLAVTGAAATALAMTGSTAPMAALGISDPRTWSSSDWIADVIPHLAYGVITAAVLRRLLRD